VPPVKKK